MSYLFASMILFDLNFVFVSISCIAMSGSIGWCCVSVSLYNFQFAFGKDGLVFVGICIGAVDIVKIM